MAEVVLERVSKVYPDGTRAVREVDLEIADGEFVVLVGPSGCGKTTLLRMVAGLEEITSGTVRIGDRVVNDVRSRDRDLAMVFQSYALYPHLTVGENIGFPLKLRKVAKGEIRTRVENAAQILGLQELLDRKPRNLSGGQRQRVAMGRAIVRDPSAFLMDEPLSNLDAKLRVQMRAEISTLQRDLETTTVYVTHDQVEAMTMGDRVAVLKKGGYLQQVDAPQVLYDEPRNLFVAAFIGSPSMNLLEGVIDRPAAGATVRLGAQELVLDDETLALHPGLEDHHGHTVVVGIRPEDVEDAALVPDAPVGHRLRVETELVEALGSEVYVHARIDAPGVLTEDTEELATDTGAVTAEQLHAEKSKGESVLVGRFSPRTQVKERARAEIVVDPTRLYFFDLESGAAIGRRRAVAAAI